MALRFETVLEALSHGFDEVIDVRSPAEFAEDRLPGAISLPVLDDAERARVGTIYKQESPFLARKLGAALVARNAAAHIEGPLRHHDGGWRPLVYCWRGGQRSGSFASILREIGWRVETVEGGYRSWRRLVVADLYDRAFPARVVLLDGNTGTAKTDLLALLASRGHQVIDLEGLANHRGSLLGATGPQPAQKGFESALADAAIRLDPDRPVFVEAESARIGSITLPPALATAMKSAPLIRLEAPMAARVGHILADYADLIADPARLDAILGRLVRYHGHERVTAWRGLAAEGAFDRLVEELIRTHYDPRYRRMSRAEAEAVPLPDLSDATLGATARRLADRDG